MKFPKTSWNKLINLVKQLFWHIIDSGFVIFTFGWVEMSTLETNNHRLPEVFIFFIHLETTAAEVHQGLQNVYKGAALSEKTFHDCFHHFKQAWLRCDDHSREGQ